MLLRFQRVALCFVITVASAGLAHAQFWIGGAGAIDPNSISKATISNGAVYVKSSSTTTNTVSVRFDVLPAGTNAKPLLSPDGTSSALRKMAVRYIDNGGSAHVVVKVRKLDINTGSTATLCTWDSNNWPQASGFQFYGGCDLFEDFDWNLRGSNGNSRHLYWVEATLTQAPGGKAVLGGVEFFYDVP